MATTPKPAPPGASAAPPKPAPRSRATTPTYDIVEECEGATSLVRSLEEVGVDVIFGIPGGAMLPTYDPLMDSTKLRHILVRHEQGAGHAASG